MPSDVKPIINRVSTFELTCTTTNNKRARFRHPRGRSFFRVRRTCIEYGSTQSPSESHSSLPAGDTASKNQMDLLPRRNLSRECMVSTNQKVSTKFNDVSERNQSHFFRTTTVGSCANWRRQQFHYSFFLEYKHRAIAMQLKIRLPETVAILEF